VDQLALVHGSDDRIDNSLLVGIVDYEFPCSGGVCGCQSNVANVSVWLGGRESR